MLRPRTVLDALSWPRDFDLPLLVAALDLIQALPRRTSRDFNASSPALGSVLSRDPPVLALAPMPRPFGAAPHFARRYPEVPFVFLVALAWSLEGPAEALALAIHARRFRQAFPRCRLVILANTERERERLDSLGIEAHVASHLAFVDDRLYRPLPGRERRFDALHNGRLAPYKRHHLAREIPTCAHITMISGFYPARLKYERLRDFVATLPTGHVLLNRTTEGHLADMSWQEVVEACSSAHVGLCLSRVEGPMNASIEYLLSGLPVVSTNSFGGRDRFFHSDTTIIARDDPGDIRDAVAALKARAIPPEAVRATTLSLVERERDRFNAFVESFGLTPIPGDPRFSFPFHHKLVSDTTIGGLEERWRTHAETTELLVA